VVGCYVVGVFVVFLFATGLAFSSGCFFYPEAWTWGMRVAVEVALLALSTGLAYAFWDMAMRAGAVVLVASCSYLTPFLSTVVSCLYLQVRPGLGLWVGCALIIAGSFLSWKSIRPAAGATVRPQAR